MQTIIENAHANTYHPSDCSPSKQLDYFFEFSSPVEFETVKKNILMFTGLILPP